jgi:hypothetical protein
MKQLLDLYMNWYVDGRTGVAWLMRDVGPEVVVEEGGCFFHFARMNFSAKPGACQWCHISTFSISVLTFSGSAKLLFFSYCLQGTYFRVESQLSLLLTQAGGLD